MSSAVRFLANFSPRFYLQMNHKRGGSVSVGILSAAPLLAYITTHRLCNYQQFCPAKNVKVTGMWMHKTQSSNFIIQCSDQLTGSYVQVCIICVVIINGIILLGHLVKRSHFWWSIKNIVRKPSCQIGVSADTESSYSLRRQLSLQTKIPHHVTFNAGVISILIPTLSSGVALFVLKLLDISIFE